MGITKVKMGKNCPPPLLKRVKIRILGEKRIIFYSIKLAGGQKFSGL